MDTKTFLSYFPGFCYQLLDDNNAMGAVKDNSLTKVGKPSDISDHVLHDFNMRGAGIYFTPNSFPDGVRQANLCKKVNAWIVENDNLPLSEQRDRLLGAPIKPSFIVQTKKSLHAYWLAAEGAQIINYRTVVKGLIKYFDGDKACSDISRIFRVPGFFHQKDRNNPYPVKIVFAEPERRYTDDQMLKTFPYAEEVAPVVKPIKNETDSFWGMLASLNNMAVLTQLSGSDMVKKEIFTFRKRLPEGTYIYVNDKACDAWIDQQGMIGSGKRGGPTWIQWLGYYGWSKGEIAKWAKENLTQAKEWVAMHEPTQATANNNPGLIIKRDYKLRYTWGTPTLDDSFAIIKRGHFIIIAAKRSSGKTTYSFDMACKNARLGHKVLYISLEMGEEEIKENVARKYAGITIPEERNYNIPECKELAFDKKIEEIDSIKNLYLRGVRHSSTVDLESLWRMTGEYKELDLIFIDNLDLIYGESREDDLERQKRVTYSIMSGAERLQIPIVLIHHYRKSIPSKNGKENSGGGMDEMSGSGKIADSADYVVNVIRNPDPNAMYPEKYRSKLWLQKARGYFESIKDVYFIKGTFMDNYPPENEYYYFEQNGPPIIPKNIEAIADAFGGEVIN